MTRKLYLAIPVLIVAASIVLAYSILANKAPEYDSSQNVINLVFKYGVGAKNELNTFEGTYTKDLVINGTITARLTLSQDELRRIQQKMVDIGFFSYPEAFPAKTDGFVTPQTD